MLTIEQMLASKIKDYDEKINALNEEIEKACNNVLLYKLTQEANKMFGHEKSWQDKTRDPLFNSDLSLSLLVDELTENEEKRDVLLKFQQKHDSITLSNLNASWLEEIQQDIEKQKTQPRSRYRGE